MTTNKEFDFSEMVCFALHSTSNAMIREYRPGLEEFDLTYSQFLVMMSLWNHDSVFISELSKETLFDASTLTPIVTKLEQKGFIQKTKSLKDERAKVVDLTRQGRALKKSTSHIFENMECRIRLTKQEQKSITSICAKIASRL